MRKKMLLTLGGVVVLLAGYCVYAIARPYVIRTEVLVDAGPDQVWKVLADRDVYQEWNPFIVKSTGELKPGGVITNVMRDTEGQERTFTPELLVVEPGRELRWLGKISPGGIFDGEHVFRLEPLPDGRTRLVQEEEFRGVAVPFTRSMLRKTIAPQFEAMNHALAARATGYE